MLPFELGRWVVHRAAASSVQVHARLAAAPSADGLVADLTLAWVDPRIRYAR